MKVRTAWLVTTIAATALLLGGCTSSSPESTDESTPAPTKTDSPFGPARPKLDAEFVSRIDGSTATIPLMTAALQLLRGSADGMQFNTTPAAYDNLIAGDKDVIFVTAPSVEEMAAAEAAGIELEVIPIVKDALVFLVNTDNPVDGLSQQQVQDIYTGQATNWSEVGGANEAIIAYQRPVNSGSQTLFLQLAMDGVTPVDAPAEVRPDGMAGLMDVVSSFDNSAQAVGFSVFYYTQEMYVKDNVKLVAIDGVAPTRETIAAGSYPFGTYYYAVVRSDEPEGSLARQLIEWALADEGQQTFSAASYVPLDPANLVEPDSGFGYLGSTLENTTESSGTGGPAGQVPPFALDLCMDRTCFYNDDDGAFVDVSLPGYPRAEAAIRAWFEALEPAELPSDMADPVAAEILWVQNIGEVVHDLMVVKRTVTVAAGAGIDLTREAAAFRLSDGHQMELSDFFYDGVNYIDFINRNLLNVDTNQLLADNLQDPGYNGPQRTGRFTGLPADAQDFLYIGWGAPRLDFQFRPGNPFLTSQLDGMAIDSFVPLNLPSDLSPYGAIWRVDHVLVNGVQVDHVVSWYEGTNPKDVVVNAQVDAWAAQQSGADLVQVWVQRDIDGASLHATAYDGYGEGLASVTFAF